jgi:ATP-dependent Clp endopeptidase proteolytic subunit ClpP
MTEIKLYDIIGGWGTSADALSALIPADEKEVTVRINSPGGDVSDGLAMYNYLRDHKAKVTTIVDGFAASAASIVLLAGDVRLVHEGSIVMVHNPWNVAVGTADDMRKAAAALDEMETAIVAIYKRRTGRKEEDLRAMLDDETYMSGARAVEEGFADRVIEDEDAASGKMAASAQWAALFTALQKGQIMNKNKTRTELEAEAREGAAEREQLAASLTEARAELDGIKADIETVKAQAIEQANAKAEALAAELGEAQAKIETDAQALADMAAALAQAKETTAAMAAEIAEVKAIVAENPAFAHAATGGEGNVTVRAQIDAEADAAEAAAQKAAETDAPKTVREQYEAMEAGQARQAFWAKHKREIIKQMEG